MASLILSTVGSIFGGRFGTILGATVGKVIDNRLFGPKGREGPRLTELAVQTSSYGTPIPQLFGTIRVAGTVVWANDLKESRTKSGGKGKPLVTTYNYSASFAVLLSARRIVGIGRIWTDGKLLRGAAGDFKVQTGFRWHDGGEDQAVDPLIAAAEGMGATPALRGQAYAVFEDLQLADYGNRIPSLTFEVIADPGDVPVGAVAAAFGVAAEAPGRALAGFSAYGDSARGVLETLAGIDGAWFATGDEAGIVMRSGVGGSTAVTDAGFAAEGRAARRTRTLAAADGVPRMLALAYYDPARDYQAGSQRAGRPGGREDRIELRAVLDASVAKAVAEGMVARANARRERRTVALAAAGLAVGPGDRVTIAGEAGLWRVARWTLERMVVRIELERIARGVAAVAASTGRVSAAPDLVHGPTTLHVFEIPPVDDAVLAAPRLTVAAAGGPGWRQAALLLSTDGGARWTEAGAATVPATMGVVTGPPGVGDPLLIDRINAIEVALLHDGMTLADADPAALDAGANLALVGDELIQFGRAAPVPGGCWRLSELRRGRRGTEAGIAGHAAGERFVLIEAAALVPIDLPLAALGGEVRLLASGVGDLSGPAAASALPMGASVRPPAPVRLNWTATPGGGAAVGWTRRSRAGWHWRDGGDAALVEESEQYRVMVGARTETVGTPAIAITAGERAAGSVAVTVRQLGTLAESLPATIVVPAS